MKKISILLTILLFALGIQAQGTFQASVGTAFSINSRSTTQFAPTIQGRVGYTVVATDATRLNLFGGYEIRQLRSKTIATPISDVSVNDQKIHVGAGIELGNRFRLGLNIGVQANPDKTYTIEKGHSRLQNHGGFTEGTISFTGNNKSGNRSTTAGFLIRAENSLKASNYFTEQKFGKNTGVITTSFFMRQNFGGKTKNKTTNYNPNTSSSSGSIIYTPTSNVTEQQFSLIRDKLLRDSTFGQALVGTMAGMTSFAVDSSKQYTDLSIAQAHSKTISEIQKDVPSSYRNTPSARQYTRQFPVYYEEGVFELSKVQKEAIQQATEGLAVNTKFLITSFSSDTGSKDRNQYIVLQRADNTLKYLKELGFTDTATHEVKVFVMQGNDSRYRSTTIQW